MQEQALAEKKYLSAQAIFRELLALDHSNVDARARLAEAVRLVRGRARLEASGGLTLDTAAAVAAPGVDFLAVGALTHSAPVLDIGLDFSTNAQEG